MTLGEYFIEDVLTITGQIKASPIVVEPVGDIAVLKLVGKHIAAISENHHGKSWKLLTR